MDRERQDRRLWLATKLSGLSVNQVLALAGADRERLRGLVDWVEDYERAERDLELGSGEG